MKRLATDMATSSGADLACLCFYRSPAVGCIDDSTDRKWGQSLRRSDTPRETAAFSAVGVRRGPMRGFQRIAADLGKLFRCRFQPAHHYSGRNADPSLPG